MEYIWQTADAVLTFVGSKVRGCHVAASCPKCGTKHTIVRAHRLLIYAPNQSLQFHCKVCRSLYEASIKLTPAERQQVKDAANS